MIGKVRQLSNDPLNENRIHVWLPLPDGSTKELWARVATLYATQGAGSFFLHEAGDEVVVGFFNQDLNCPVILGSLIGSKQTPAYARTEQNQKKAIVTREKLKIEFDEENQRFRVKPEVEEGLFYHECYDEFRNESFWEELAVRLADRDLVRAIGMQTWEKLTEEERRARTGAWEKRYWEEFSKHGVEHVVVIAPQGEG